MMKLCAILILFVFTTPSWGKELEAFPDLQLNDAQGLKEATRVLEEELKLAARPQTYVLIDLVGSTIQIKGRGIGLHQIPIIRWSGESRNELKGIHKLVARPSVVRRKIDPGAAGEQEPISLADMPTDYVLSFTPQMTIAVVPSTANESFLRGVAILGKSWWHNVQHWTSSLFTGTSSATTPHLQLTISADYAQSLAWSLVDGMAIVIRRPTDK
ncbi:MAG: hypothetical protein E8D40_01810 [Nitrospira sp.]|nr:MAG: hypothetical protein E8D40_01810 [Nitrospira sp.]